MTVEAELAFARGLLKRNRLSCMGIDIIFTHESLKKCKYAVCRPYRTKVAAFYAAVPTEGQDELLPYREMEYMVNMNLLKQEEPTIYHELTKDEKPVVQSRPTWPWKMAWFKEYYANPSKKKRLKPYILPKPTGKVLLKKMPEQLAQEWVERVDELDLIPAWWELPQGKHKEICKPCPIRPLDQDNCCLLFGSYDEMDFLKHGFLLTALYATSIDEEQMGRAPLPFRHLDRNKGELPRDKLEQLYQLCQGEKKDWDGEEYFDEDFLVLSELFAVNYEPKPVKMDMVPKSFVDMFLSKFIYRDEPYNQEEIKLVLPYLETFEDVAKWAMFDIDGKQTRTKIIAFRDRLHMLVTALRIGEKYGIEPDVIH